ncbi:uncharacterized protein BP5553_05485 [Venustampulla echinocandica]|uniref:Uncharacterized protein n=1 Tax=Venustampulla echinocandica TaxID=2656787 RepID=A0A370TR95_9HELO|nr:uncharacterized protein BP5553_05485 [Venustampulla echinocandica]RDL38052.1 hypothetical protein BP5553_05485 [Venustampulla echinocandica]
MKSCGAAALPSQLKSASHTLTTPASKLTTSAALTSESGLLKAGPVVKTSAVALARKPNFGPLKPMEVTPLSTGTGEPYSSRLVRRESRTRKSFGRATAASGHNRLDGWLWPPEIGCDLNETSGSSGQVKRQGYSNEKTTAIKKYDGDGPEFEETQGRSKRARYENTVGQDMHDEIQLEKKENELFDLDAYEAQLDISRLPSPLEQSPSNVQKEGDGQSENKKMMDWDDCGYDIMDNDDGAGGIDKHDDEEEEDLCVASFSHTIICLQHINDPRAETTSISCPNYKQQHTHYDGGGCDCKIGRATVSEDRECVYKQRNRGKSFSFEERDTDHGEGIRYLLWRGDLGYGPRWKTEVRRLIERESEMIAVESGNMERERLRWVAVKEAMVAGMDTGVDQGTEATAERKGGIERGGIADGAIENTGGLATEEIRGVPKQEMLNIKMEDDEDISSLLARVEMVGTAEDEIIDVKVEDDKDMPKTKDTLWSLPANRTAAEWRQAMDATRSDCLRGLSIKKTKGERRRWQQLRNQAFTMMKRGDSRDVNQIVLELNDEKFERPPPRVRKRQGKRKGHGNDRNKL